MKTIIAGSRSCTDIAHIRTAFLNCPWAQDISEIVSGAAPGADRLGEQLAASMNIPVKRFPADWNAYGKSAGYRRNNEMARYADALIAIWDGQSNGTRHMIGAAERNGLRCFVWRINPPST